jgi:hypothetical protein
MTLTIFNNGPSLEISFTIAQLILTAWENDHFIATDLGTMNYFERVRKIECSGNRINILTQSPCKDASGFYVAITYKHPKTTDSRFVSAPIRYEVCETDFIWLIGLLEKGSNHALTENVMNYLSEKMRLNQALRSLTNSRPVV